jgi:hypothetical protein
MNGHEDFQQTFDALDVTMRAALVFRYREGLPLSHVAQLVERPVRKLGPEMDRVVAGWAESGVLAEADVSDPGPALAAKLDAMRGDPALTAFNLVRAVRAEQNRPGLLRGLVLGPFMRRFA